MSIKDFLDEKMILNILLFFVPGFLLIQTYRYVSGMERTNTNDRLIIYSIVVSFIFNFIYNLLYKWVMTWPKVNDTVVQTILIASILVVCVLLGVILGKTNLPEKISIAICRRTQEESALMAFINKNKYNNVTATIIKKQDKKTLYYTGQVHMFPENQTNSEYVLWHYRVHERIDDTGGDIKYILTRDYNRDNQVSDRSFLYIKAEDEIHFYVEDSENISQIIELFMAVVFGRDGKINKDEWAITRWTGDIKFEIKGTKKDEKHLDTVINELRKIEGMPRIHRVEGGGNNRIHFDKKKSDIITMPGNASGGEYYTKLIQQGNRIESADSFIDKDEKTQREIYNMIIKCVLRSLGMQYDVNNKYGRSVFQKDCLDMQYLSDLDLRIIEMLYSPVISPDMQYKEAIRKLKLWLKNQKEFD